MSYIDEVDPLDNSEYSKSSDTADKNDTPVSPDSHPHSTSHLDSNTNSNLDLDSDTGSVSGSLTPREFNRDASRNPSTTSTTVKKVSTRQSIVAKLRLTSKERLHVAVLFTRVYVKIFTLFLGIVAIFYGTYYNRESRYINLTTWVVLSDTSFDIPGGATMDPVIANTLIEMVTQNQTIVPLLGWKIVPESEVLALAQKSNRTITQELQYQVRHQKIWTAFHIQANASQALFNSLASGTPAMSPNVSRFIDVIFEQGRHYSSLTQYVEKHISQAQELWLSYYTSSQVMQPILGNLTSEQRANIVSSNSSLLLLQTPITFHLMDLSPPLLSTALGPSQLGLIYAQVFSFHQFNFSLQIHMYLKDKLKVKDYVVYRFLASQLNCLVLAFAYGLVTLAFQVPLGLAFGKGGFMVIWMLMYLFISALSGINENVTVFLLSHGLQQWIAPWMVFYVIANISPTFSDPALCPEYYKYGYGLPMFNIFEAFKVVFFDAYRGTIGRNVGVLVGWIVFTNILLFFHLRHLLRKEKEKKMLEEEEKIKEKLPGYVKPEPEPKKLLLQKIPGVLHILEKLK